MEVIANSILVHALTKEKTWTGGFLDRPFYIYAIKCQHNGKMYIGRTRHPRLRIKSHVQALRRHDHRCKDMQSDYDKYGDDNFVCQLLECVEQNREAEKDYMRLYKTFDPIYGYNNNDVVAHGLRANST